MEESILSPPKFKIVVGELPNIECDYAVVPIDINYLPVGAGVKILESAPEWRTWLENKTKARGSLEWDEILPMDSESGKHETKRCIFAPILSFDGAPQTHHENELRTVFHSCLSYVNEQTLSSIAFPLLADWTGYPVRSELFLLAQTVSLFFETLPEPTVGMQKTTLKKIYAVCSGTSEAARMTMELGRSEVVLSRRGAAAFRSQIECRFHSTATPPVHGVVFDTPSSSFLQQHQEPGYPNDLLSTNPVLHEILSFADSQAVGRCLSVNSVFYNTINRGWKMMQKTECKLTIHAQNEVISISVTIRKNRIGLAVHAQHIFVPEQWLAFEILKIQDKPMPTLGPSIIRFQDKASALTDVLNVFATRFNTQELELMFTAKGAVCSLPQRESVARSLLDSRIKVPYLTTDWLCQITAPIYSAKLAESVDLSLLRMDNITLLNTSETPIRVQYKVLDVQQIRTILQEWALGSRQILQLVLDSPWIAPVDVRHNLLNRDRILEMCEDQAWSSVRESGEYDVFVKRTDKDPEFLISSQFPMKLFTEDPLLQPTFPAIKPKTRRA